MEKPSHPRTSAHGDSQSLDTTSGGEPRGRDNAQDVDGRERQIVVDGMGLLLAIRKPSVNPSPTLGAHPLSDHLSGWPQVLGLEFLRARFSVGATMCPAPELLPHIPTPVFAPG